MVIGLLDGLILELVTAPTLAAVLGTEVHGAFAEVGAHLKSHEIVGHALLLESTAFCGLGVTALEAPVGVHNRANSRGRGGGSRRRA